MSSKFVLDFEKDIYDLSRKIDAIKNAEAVSEDMIDDINKLISSRDKKITSVYNNLTPWQKVSVARHPSRPHASNYIKHIFGSSFIELKGDRLFKNDEAIIGGIGKIGDRSVMVIGIEKGHDTTSRLKHNFGMPQPEGYRRAMRLMSMADKFKLPIITLVDTAGAFPGIEAEQRGQASAIANSISTMLSIDVPVISIIIGEGGSGGAIALATANFVAMLEHSVYSVISPEGCASILWRDSSMAKDAAEQLKITATNLKDLGIIDDIIPEPIGAAHNLPEEAMSSVKDYISNKLDNIFNNELDFVDGFKSHRRHKYINITK